MGPKQGTGSKTPAAKIERKPIYDKLLGRIDEVPCAVPIDHPPKVQKFGICSKPTDAVKKPIDGASMMVRSNYVRVTKVPTDHNVYSLDFSTQRPLDSRSSRSLGATMRRNRSFTS
jgi:hypothetical protein